MSNSVVEESESNDFNTSRNNMSSFKSNSLYVKNRPDPYSNGHQYAESAPADQNYLSTDFTASRDNPMLS